MFVLNKSMYFITNASFCRMVDKLSHNNLLTLKQHFLQKQVHRNGRSILRSYLCNITYWTVQKKLGGPHKTSNVSWCASLSATVQYDLMEFYRGVPCVAFSNLADKQQETPSIFNETPSRLLAVKFVVKGNVG